MKLPSVRHLKLKNKRVFLRTNYDVVLTPAGKIVDDSRIVESLPTIHYLQQQKAKIVIGSHLGRPGGKRCQAFSLSPVAAFLGKLLNKRIEVVSRLAPFDQEMVMLENLRFWSEEEENKQTFAKKLAGLADFYVNDAFAASHRQHASLVGLPLFLPQSHCAFGLDFLTEIKMLTKVKKKPSRPVVVILGGVKEGKVKAAQRLIKWADFILIGGQMVLYQKVHRLINRYQKIVGDLTKDGEDITIKTINEFKKIIALAKTIIWSGPMGACEEKKYEKGTREIAQAVAQSRALKIVGGGDTEAALTKFGLTEKIDFISSGGGAMLAFLADDTLPAIEVIRKRKKK